MLSTRLTILWRAFTSRRKLLQSSVIQFLEEKRKEIKTKMYENRHHHKLNHNGTLSSSSFFCIWRYSFRFISVCSVGNGQEEGKK